MKFINVEKIKEMLSKNTIFVKISPFVLLVSLLLTGCGKNKENNKSDDNNNNNVVSFANTFGPAYVKSERKIYTLEEKIAYVNDNYKEFMNRVNQIPGIELDDNAAKLQLSFINGLAPEETGVITNDYVLDFITDYENIWNRLTVDAMNYLVNDIELKVEKTSLHGIIYSNYMIDKQDSESYEYFAGKTLTIVSLAFDGKDATAKYEAKCKNKLNAEVLLLDQLYDNKDFNNLSEEVQYMIRYLAFLDTHFLAEKTSILVNTKAGEQEFINYNNSIPAKHYSTNDGSYVLTGNIGNDMSYFMEKDSVNVTMKYWLGSSICNDDPKKLVK